MIRHIAMFTWSDEATTSQIGHFAAGLSSMPNQIGTIRRYEHGDDLDLSPGTADYVLVADFDSVEGYRQYADHPIHLEFIEASVKPIVASISRVQMHIAT
ncbi:MAG: Dabb family protein [bacterium]|nr:Dabb family protein [bacterium]